MDETRTAERIIALRDEELAKASNFRSLYQEAADFVNPRENQITEKSSPGQDTSTRFVDGTAVQDSQILAAGLSTMLVPNGQAFFALTALDPDQADLESAKRYFMKVAEITHERIFASNFTLSFNETVHTVSSLGTGCLYVEWDNNDGGLNFRDYDISMYLIKQNSKGRVDTIILSYEMTARQAVQEFGQDNCSEEIVRAAEDLKTESKLFPFIHIVRPRRMNPLAKKIKDRFKFESLHVDEKGKQIVKQEGYETFPFAVVRWRLSSSEKYGRGQALSALADIRSLQAMRESVLGLANRMSSPPLEVVLESIEGVPDVRANALNWVTERNSIQAVNSGAIGNYPITVDMIEKQQEIIHEAFYRKILRQFSDLKGDRRTTVEIRMRALESMKVLAQPVARLQEELLTPIITRTIHLLLKWGVIPPPPAGLRGYKIEYLGQLALALRDQHATAAMQFMELVGNVAQIQPDVIDILDFDVMMPDIAATFGMDESHIATSDEIAEKRQVRADQLAAQQEMQEAEVAGKAYKATKDAPQKGSPAEQVMAGAGA